MKKILLITGGSRGIGASIARAAAKQFDTVCFTYRQQQATALQLAGDLSTDQCQVVALQLDVADENAVNDVFAKIERDFGQLTALVNNAGIVAPKQRLEKLDSERLQRIFAVNCFGAFYCCREAVKQMSTHNGGTGGTIVNISSGAARLGSPGEYIDYAAAKAAVETLTLGLAKEVAAENIRVNAVAPGIIDTDLHADSGDRERPQKLKHRIPLGRPGEAEEIANAVLWLLSPQASYVTGTVLSVTGGF